MSLETNILSISQEFVFNSMTDIVNLFIQS